MRPNLLVIRSKDIDSLAAFYTRLGAHFEKHRHGKGPLHYAYEANQFVFEIYPLANGYLPTTSMRLGFAVDSVDEVIEHVKQSNQGKIISEPKDSPWGRRAVIDDPEGHRIELIQT